MSIVDVTNHTTVPDKAIKDFRGAEGAGTQVGHSQDIPVPVNPWKTEMDPGTSAAKTVIDRIDAPDASNVDPWLNSQAGVA